MPLASSPRAALTRDTDRRVPPPAQRQLQLARHALLLERDEPGRGTCARDRCGAAASVPPADFRARARHGQVLQGAPPALEQLGPFVFRETVAKYNIEFTSDAPARVSWQQLAFHEFLPAKSCATCRLNATARRAAASAAGILGAMLPRREVADVSRAGRCLTPTRRLRASWTRSTGTRCRCCSPSCRCAPGHKVHATSALFDDASSRRARWTAC